MTNHRVVVRRASGRYEIQGLLTHAESPFMLPKVLPPSGGYGTCVLSRIQPTYVLYHEIINAEGDSDAT